VYAGAEVISTTNGTGIAFLAVCCAAVSFMVWVFVSLTRERQTRYTQFRLQVQVRSSDWEPSRVQKINAQHPVVCLRVPVDARHGGTSRQPANDIAASAAKWRRWG